MDIQNRKELKTFAAERLNNAPQAGKIVAIYAAVVIGLSMLTAIVNHVLGLQIDQTGGLSNLGTRSILSTLQTMLPLVQSVVVLCIEIGYLAAMLRVARGQYVSPNTLRLGMDRFWVLIRYTILETAIFMGLGFASMYLGIMIYMMTPLSNPVMELLTPIVSQTSVLNTAVTVPDALYNQLIQALIPAFLIFGLIYCVVGLPLMYRLRMSRYVIIDKPGLGALAAMRESKKMMRRNCFSLFKLDLSMWWFYGATVLASIVCYGDLILLNLGIELPFSEDVGFFLFYGFYWALQFMIYYFLRNKVEVSYALAYDAIRPRENPQGGGVVLGNIFQM